MNQSWTLTKDTLTRTEWDRLHASVPAPYQQDWCYGEVMKRKGAKVTRIAIHDPAGTICGLAQFILRPFALVAQFALCTYGPVWLKPLSLSDKTAALRALRRDFRLRWPRLVAMTPDEDISLNGFHRIMTGDATVRLDLTRPEDELRQGLDGKWRNRLVAAEKSTLKFTASAAKPGQYQWLLEEEIRQRGKKGYHGLPPDMVSLWQEDKARAKGADRKAGLLVFRADLESEPAAAMLFLTHGRMATYHIGWQSEDGRKAGAHNLILWNAMLALKQRGIHTLDLGGVNTGKGAGIARFKLGTGGEVVKRSGVWV